MMNKEYSLLNVDYNNFACVKSLYRSQSYLRAQSENGNSVASCILIDIQNAAKNVLTDKQKLYANLLLIEGYTLADVAVKYQTTSSNVYSILNKEIANIKAYLSEKEEE